MITEDPIIAYFDKLAKANRLIAHDQDGVPSFFEIEDPEELSSFDDALRNATGSTVMLIIAGEGELNDNGSANYTDGLEYQIYVLQKLHDDTTPSEIRAVCKDAIKAIIFRTRKDASASKIVPGKFITFPVNNLPLRKVGPMNLHWYGYTAMLSFTCPFGWKVDSGTWTDIP
jgi:hypothetical protein